MKNCILEKLREIEKSENIKILLAVESGSRAWGFESTDSDYDVRFIYVRPQKEYLRLDSVRDVIELPINDELDINGWDLFKTLRLLHKSNPTLFEWFSSPIVYYEDRDFCQAFRPILQRYFIHKSSLWHYLSMAKSNFREYLSEDFVKLKKYFYVLRPVLACRWILEHKSPPPMKFEELVGAELDATLRSEVEHLLDLKRNSPEIKLIPRVESLNSYMDASIEEVAVAIHSLPEQKEKEWNELNEFFYQTLQRYENL